MTRDDYQALLYRNEASLYLDDLVALVVNSALAFDLRLFSTEVMELTPGFTFNLSQARALKDLARRRLQDYRAHRITDVDLMDFMAQGRSIIKNDIQKTGGDFMGLINRLIHGKEIKTEENFKNLELSYRNVCQKIFDCQEKINRAVDAAKGNPPDSMIYRDSELAYKNAKNELTLLSQQELQLRQALEAANKMKLLQDYGKQQDEIRKITDLVLGDQKKQVDILTKVEVNNGKLSSILDKVEGFGNDVFSKAEESISQPSTQSEFGALVATKERQDSLMEMTGVPVGETKQSTDELHDEFSSLVSRDSEQGK